MSRDEQTYNFQTGNSALLVSLPHGGEHVPPEIADRLSDQGRRIPDTDWHTPRLYAFAADLGASVLTANFNRYVVDLNRPPDGAALYPGANNTGIVPTTSFDEQPLYAHGPPTPEEVAQRIARYYRPYHDALSHQLSRIRARHGHAVLFDAHSIRGEVPRFFVGQLPDLNLGTDSDRSCCPELQRRATTLLAESTYSTAINGRFKGGYITRYYGDPTQRIHALQLELAQRNYMDEATFDYMPARAAALQDTLKRLLSQLRDWKPSAP